MHLEKAYLTTTRYNNKKKKSNSKRLAQAQTEHEAWLKSIGVGKSVLPIDKKGKRVGLYEIPDYTQNKPAVQLSNNIAGNGTATKQHVYSGERVLLGVATMHKSNMVPIFADKKEDAIDIAQMRRN